MATRIDIELTSTQDDGQTFTWRAAGAKKPKGVAPAAIFPEGSSVGDEFKVEAEMNLDGIEILQVIPPKDKKTKQIQTLELIGRDDEPLVTQQLAKKGRGDRGDRGDRRGGRRRDRKDGDRDGKGRGRSRGDGDGDGGRGRGGDRPRTPAKPKLPPKPKPPRLKAGKTHRNALLAELPEEHKAVANQLLSGGLQAVRSGLASQNEQRKAKGESPIDDGPIMDLAEKLLLRVRAAEWRDRAEAALEQAPTVDLRDLRSVVTAADGAAKDDETRALAAQLREALSDRLEADQQAWIAEVIEMLDDDRVVRALHLSSRPPKAGAPLPAPVALRLVEAANAAMSADTSPDRWTYILDALAHSPIRRQVVPVSLPTNVTLDLKTAIARHGNRLPEIAEIFGVTPDPKAGGGPAKRSRRGKKASKSSGGRGPKAADAKGSDSKGDDAAKGGDAKAGDTKGGGVTDGDAGDRTDAGEAKAGAAEAGTASAPAAEPTGAPDSSAASDEASDSGAASSGASDSGAASSEASDSSAASSDADTPAGDAPAVGAPAEGDATTPSADSDGAARSADGAHERVQPAEDLNAGPTSDDDAS